LVGDVNVNDNWHIAFFNIKTDKEVRIVTELPPYSRRPYHVHPHPQFCVNDRYICYTTNVLGTADVALVSVAQLIAATE
jgi:hypothetical protein